MIKSQSLFGASFIAVSLAFAPAAFAAEKATQAEAKAMVKKAVEFHKANGKDKLLAAVSDNKGAFIDRDLYVAVYSMKGFVIAHGVNPKLIGKDVSELKDADGKQFVKEIIAKAASAGSGTVDYKWVNPVSKAIESKTVYLEKADDVIIAAGAYKP